MKQQIHNKLYVIAIILLFLIFAMVSCFITHSVLISEHKLTTIDSFVTYTVDPKLHELNFYWKNDSGEIIRNIKNLDKYVRSKNARLIFATNGGMYQKDYSPQGLYIENYKTYKPIDTLSGSGNFYLKPNGIFYISDINEPNVCATEEFKLDEHIKYATQSGPMLLINGKIHPAFTKGSHNLHIRNGVGVLPNNQIIFVMSKVKVNFWDFANYFKSLGCKNALYLDGFVSRTFAPEQFWFDIDGDFGVIIGVVISFKDLMLKN